MARTEARAAATEYLEPSRTYYLKGGIGMGFFVGHPKLAFVDESTGRAEVAECKLLQSK